MLSELQKRKLTALFNHEDLNHDGIIEASDYEESDRKILESLELSPGSPEYDSIQAQLRTSREGFVKFLERKGGRLTVDGYLEYLDLRISSKETLTQFIPGYVRFMLRLWDRDDDGRLSADEFVRLEWCYGVNDASAREAFGRLDRNGDGYLTVEELIEDIEEFYYSQDPGAPGNWLFGPY